MSDKEKKNKIADILLDFYDEYRSNEINRPMIPSIYAGKIINSLQEESVSEDLEDFALQYAGHHAPYDSCMQEVEDAVKVGAEWQKQKDEHLFDKEFSAGYTEGQLAEISQSTIDAIRKEYKQQMMKNAYKGYVSYIRDDSEAVVYLKDSCITMPSYFPKSNLKDGDNVRILVIKDK